MLKIKKKDNVMILKGRDKGKKGEVHGVLPDKNKVLVSGVGVAKKHTRPTQNTAGGIQDKEMPISVANVGLVCPKCKKVTRVKFDKLSSGEKVRLCKKCNEVIL
jgi:large subunit ribosomal protein L24